MTKSYIFNSARFKRLKQWMLVRERLTAMGLYQTIGMHTIQRLTAARLEMIKAQRKKVAHLAMKAVPYTVEYNVFAVESQHTEQPEFLNDTSLMEKVDSNTTPNSSDMCNNEFQADQNVDDDEDELVVLAKLIANLKLDIDENKIIQNQLRKSNVALTHELNECKSALEESNDIRDRCRSALHHQDIKLERNSSKRVSFQSLVESVGSNDMVHNYYLEEAKKKVQIQKDKALNSKPSVIIPAKIKNTVNCSKLKLRNSYQQPWNWPLSMSSHVSNRAVNIAEPPMKSKPF
nr:hypothetical protein [Tanacetum cinerariifolium]